MSFSDTTIWINGEDTGVPWSSTETQLPEVREILRRLLGAVDQYLLLPAKYGDAGNAAARETWRDYSFQMLALWKERMGEGGLSIWITDKLCAPSKMLEESLVQLEAAKAKPEAPNSVFPVFHRFLDTVHLLCQPEMRFHSISSDQMKEAVSIIHHRVIPIAATLDWQEIMSQGGANYSVRAAALGDWFLLHARLLGTLADPLPLVPGDRISQAEYDVYTAALRKCRPKIEEWFPSIFAATWDKYKAHPMWSDSMAGGFNPITGTYNESTPQRSPSTNPRSSMSARKRSYLDSLTAATIPSDQCDSQGDAVLPDPDPDPDLTKKEAPMATPLTADAAKSASLTVIEEVRLNPGDSYFTSVFAMLKLGGSTALAAKMSDGMATLIMERLPRALPFLAPLMMIPGISKAFALASPPLVGWLCHNRYIPKMFLSDQKQGTLAVWCLLATLGQTNKFLYDLGDDLMGKLWKSMRDILEDEDEGLLKKTMQNTETPAS